MCTAACQNCRDLYAVRFILGFFESITFTVSPSASCYTRGSRIAGHVSLAHIVVYAIRASVSCRHLLQHYFVSHQRPNLL